jgi:hypothetical protein
VLTNNSKIKNLKFDNSGRPGSVIGGMDLTDQKLSMRPVTSIHRMKEN